MFRRRLQQLRIAIPYALRHPVWSVFGLVSACVLNARFAWRRWRGRRIVLFYIDHQKYLPFTLPIWEQLPDGVEHDVDLYVVTRPESRASVKRAMAAAHPRPRGYLLSWSVALLKAYDLYVTTHPTSIVPILGNRPRVCTFHGLPAKGGAFSAGQWKFLDGAFLTGPLQESLFEELRESSSTEQQLWARHVGYPKSDALINGGFDRNSVLRQCGLDPSRPTVLFAPTWEPHGSLRNQGVEIVETLCRLPLNVLLKLHPMSYFPSSNWLATGGVDWRSTFARFEPLKQFHHVTEADVGPFVSAADVLVTDVSSVAHEAILSDTPIVILETPGVFEIDLPRLHAIDANAARSDPRHNCGRDAALVIQQIAELPVAVTSCLENPDQYAQERAMLRRKLVFNPGRAAEAAASEIIELLDLRATYRQAG